jgi:serine phosphatase RsbU (regulator of sigma subunit)
MEPPMDEKSAATELDNFTLIARELIPLPGDIPSIEGIDIYGQSRQLGGPIGGDHIIYIDFNRRFDLDERIREARKAGKQEVADRLGRNRTRAGLLVADVSGHQITDALLSAMLHQAFLLGVSYELDSSGEITTNLFENINNRFYQSSAISKFITMMYGEISSSGDFRFISAGHPPPIVFSHEFNKIVEISSDRLTGFFPIGTRPSANQVDYKKRIGDPGHLERYGFNQISLLGKGDIMLLYTDGLLDHVNGEDDSYFPCLLELRLRDVKDLSAREIYFRLIEDMIAFGELSDDLTLLVVKKDR